MIKHVHTIRRLYLSVILNLFISIAEFIGGIISGSLSLLADALHNFIDSFSLLISLIAFKLSLRPPNKNYTYGYRRIGILVGLFNLSLLFGVSLFLFKESIERIFRPRMIDTTLMLSIAAIGLLVNVVTAILLFKDARKNLNVKAAYFHIVADAVSSVGVIIAGIIIYLTHFYLIDVILTFVIASYILYVSVNTSKEILPILMQCVPINHDLMEIAKALKSVPGVENVHHLHLWSLDEHEKYLECHVKIKEKDLNNIETIKKQLKNVLEKQFGIFHSTLEFEIKSCKDVAIINKHEEVSKYYH